MEKNSIKKNYLYVSSLIDVIIFVVTLILVFAFDDNIENIRAIGLLLIITSVNMVIKARNNKFILILFAIICYINLSLALEDFFLTDSIIFVRATYQYALRYSSYNTVAAKAILLLNAVISVLLPRRVLKLDTKQQMVIKDNPIIYFGAICVLIYGLIFGIERGSGVSYTSNTNTLYEYCIVIFAFAWIYAGNSKNKKFFLQVYAIAYILQGFLLGDRSSMFPMCVLIVLLSLTKIRLRYVVILCLFGVFATNFIAEYRNNFELPPIIDVLERGIKSDTVTYSHYAALTIFKTKDIVGDTLPSMIDFVFGIFLGGNFGEANVTRIAKEYVGNIGGGFYYSFFFYWLGYFGVVVAAIIVGGTMRLLMKRNGQLARLILIISVAMSFRWYLYGPITLIRTSIVIPCILWFMCNLLDKLLRSGKNI